jgi:hypothetical protein
VRRFARRGRVDSASTSSIRSRPRSDSTSATRAAASVSRSRASQPRRAPIDRLGQLPVLAREQHLLPAAQLVAQLLIAPRLGRLPLQRAALLLDLEDDVVDAGQVQLRRFELQLRRAAPRLVLGDARGFLDQLTPIGRPRAEDHPDLALLDDRVGLGAEARVHQQIVDVAQAADLPSIRYSLSPDRYSRRVTSISRATDWMIASMSPPRDSGVECCVAGQTSHGRSHAVAVAIART